MYKKLTFEQFKGLKKAMSLDAYNEKFGHYFDLDQYTEDTQAICYGDANLHLEYYPAEDAYMLVIGNQCWISKGRNHTPLETMEKILYDYYVEN